MKKEVDNFKVDFIGIGAPRCGTTWISRCLAEHPQICFSEPKETHFFNKDENYKKGIEYYKTFFKNYQEGQIRGEFSPFYYLSEDAAKRIKAHNPNVKLIVILRNPVDRALSNYIYRKNKFREKLSTFEEAFQKDDRYLEHSMYYKYLNNFLNNFDLKRVFFIIHEYSVLNPNIILEELFNFLDIKMDYVPSVINAKINSSDNIKFKKRTPLVMYNVVKKIKQNQAGKLIIEILKIVKINSVFKYIMEKNIKHGTNNTSSRVIQNRDEYLKMFENDIHDLEKAYNLKLNIWRI